MTQVEGGIQIRRVGTGKTPAEAAYNVMFVPDPRGVGALADRRIDGEDGLRGFLRRVGIHGRLIEEAVGALRQAPAHQITHVLLTPAQIKQLRL